MNYNNQVKFLSDSEECHSSIYTVVNKNKRKIKKITGKIFNSTGLAAKKCN